MPKNTNGLVKPLKLQDLEKNAQYTCEICQKVFKNEAILLEHSISHTGERPYCCCVCNKSYPLVKGLKVHMRLIHGPAYQEREHPDQCNVCGIKISKLFRLIEHEISHTGELPYQCLICKEKFSMTQTLAIHMKKHSSARNTVNTVALDQTKEDLGSGYNGHYSQHQEDINTQPPTAVVDVEKSVEQPWRNFVAGPTIVQPRRDLMAGLDLTSQKFDPGSGIGSHWNTGIGPPLGHPRY